MGMTGNQQVETAGRQFLNRFRIVGQDDTRHQAVFRQKRMVLTVRPQIRQADNFPIGPVRGEPLNLIVKEPDRRRFKIREQWLAEIRSRNAEIVVPNTAKTGGATSRRAA